MVTTASNGSQKLHEILTKDNWSDKLKPKWRKEGALKDSHLFKKLETGFDRFTILTEKGDLIGEGYGYHGEFGTGFAAQIPIPTYLTHFKQKGIKIVDVCCGVFHTLFLDDQGNAYGCGRTEEGALGVKFPEKQLFPQLLHVSKVDRIITSYRSRYSFFLKQDKVIRFGKIPSDNNTKKVTENDQIECVYDMGSLHATNCRFVTTGRNYCCLIFGEYARMKFMSIIRSRRIFFDVRVGFV
jgi:hypothetical protein